jgi:hypothetical protein
LGVFVAPDSSAMEQMRITISKAREFAGKLQAHPYHRKSGGWPFSLLLSHP